MTTFRQLQKDDPTPNIVVKILYPDGRTGNFFLNVNEKTPLWENRDNRGNRKGGQAVHIHHAPPVPAKIVERIVVSEYLAPRVTSIASTPVDRRVETRVPVKAAPITPTPGTQLDLGQLETKNGIAASFRVTTVAIASDDDGYSSESDLSGVHAEESGQVGDLINAMSLVDVSSGDSDDGCEQVKTAVCSADAPYRDMAMRYTLIEKVMKLPAGKLPAALEALESLVVDEETV